MPPLNKSSGPNSFQGQVEEYIDEGMQKCADFSSFSEQGIEVVMNSSKTYVTIGSSDLSIRSEIPLQIKSKLTKQSADFKKRRVMVWCACDVHARCRQKIEKKCDKKSGLM